MVVTLPGLPGPVVHILAVMERDFVIEHVQIPQQSEEV